MKFSHVEAGDSVFLLMEESIYSAKYFRKAFFIREEVTRASNRTFTANKALFYQTGIPAKTNGEHKYVCALNPLQRGLPYTNNVIAVCEREQMLSHRRKLKAIKNALSFDASIVKIQDVDTAYMKAICTLIINSKQINGE